MSKLLTLSSGVAIPLVSPDNINNNTWEIFRKIGLLVKYKKKSVLFEEKQSLTHIYILVSGYCKILKSKAILDIVEPGQSLGAGLLNYESNATILYPITCVALTDIEVIKISKNEILKNLLIYPDLNAYFYLQFQKRIEFLQNCKNLQQKKLIQKVSLILILKKHLLDKGFITRKLIAEIINASTESVIRSLIYLKNQKVIAVKTGNIQILDIEVLTRELDI